MSKKKGTGNVVYSTDPDFIFSGGSNETQTLSPAEQQLVIKKDTKHRKGKVVTLVEGFEGKDEDLQKLGKKLKTACGAGGSAKEGVIIVQGDHQEKVREILKGWGYKLKK